MLYPTNVFELLRQVSSFVDLANERLLSSCGDSGGYFSKFTCPGRLAKTVSHPDTTN